MMVLRLIVLLIGIGLSSLSPARAVEIPDGYREPPYLAATPDHLPGATTLTAVQAWEAQQNGAVLIDASPATLGSYGKTAGQWVIKAEHRSIAGSVWLPNVGEYQPPPEVERWFAAELNRLSHGDRAAPLVFFCRPDCWMSWNAAKRALALGYTRVFWYRDGIPGWEVELYPLLSHTSPATFYDPSLPAAVSISKP